MYVKSPSCLCRDGNVMYGVHSRLLVNDGVSEIGGWGHMSLSESSSEQPVWVFTCAGGCVRVGLCLYVSVSVCMCVLAFTPH